MKYIVVYIILILGISSLKTEAQKLSIDLLPSANASMQPQAMIDTCVIPDSLFLIDSIAPLPETGEKISTGARNPVKDTHALRRRSIVAFTLYKPGLFPLFIRDFNPIHIIIHFTALKF